MVTAEQIMTKDILTVTPESSILEVVRLLTENRISGLPVADREMNLRGIITEKDILRLLVDEQVRGDVSAYMSHKVTSFKATDSIVEICNFFIKSHIRRVPIVNEDNKLVGVVSRRDIISEIKRIRSI